MKHGRARATVQGLGAIGRGHWQNIYGPVHSSIGLVSERQPCKAQSDGRSHTLQSIRLGSSEDLQWQAQYGDWDDWGCHSHVATARLGDLAREGIGVDPFGILARYGSGLSLIRSPRPLLRGFVAAKSSQSYANRARKLTTRSQCKKMAQHSRNIRPIAPKEFDRSIRAQTAQLSTTYLSMEEVLLTRRIFRHSTPNMDRSIGLGSSIATGPILSIYSIQPEQTQCGRSIYSLQNLCHTQKSPRSLTRAIANHSHEVCSRKSSASIVASEVLSPFVPV